MPAGLITLPIDELTLGTTCRGFQFSSPAFLMVCAANLGVVKLMRISAPTDFIFTTCESIVGSLTS